MAEDFKLDVRLRTHRRDLFERQLPRENQPIHSKILRVMRARRIGNAHLRAAVNR